MTIRTLTAFFILSLSFLGTASCAEQTPPTNATSSTETTKTEPTTNTHVVLETSKGDIELLLEASKAPITVANFLKHVNSGHYDGTIFHRVIDHFMIQGGGFRPDMTKKTVSNTIQNEADNGLKNIRGSIAMARRNAPHSAQAQFFINVKDNPNLDHTRKTPDGWGYAVFGHVVEGMDVVDAIRTTPTTVVNGYRDVPQNPILIKKAYVK